MDLQAHRWRRVLSRWPRSSFNDSAARHRELERAASCHSLGCGLFDARSMIIFTNLRASARGQPAHWPGSDGDAFSSRSMSGRRVAVCWRRTLVCSDRPNWSTVANGDSAHSHPLVATDQCPAPVAHTRTQLTPTNPIPTEMWKWPVPQVAQVAARTGGARLRLQGTC